MSSSPAAENKEEKIVLRFLRYFFTVGGLMTILDGFLKGNDGVGIVMLGCLPLFIAFTIMGWHYSSLLRKE